MDFAVGGAASLFPRLDLRDRLFHQVGHGDAQFLIGNGDLLGLQILLHLAEDVVIAGFLEVGHHDILGVGVGFRAAQSELRRGPCAEQLVPPRIGLEAKLFVVSELLLEAFFTLVERRHAAPRVSIERVDFPT